VPNYFPEYLKAVWPEILGCHEMTLELVCGADFWCRRNCRTSPVDLEGFRGHGLAEIQPKTDPNKSGQTAFRYLMLCFKTVLFAHGCHLGAMDVTKPYRFMVLNGHGCHQTL
jgi:hypothetical protein